MFLLSYILIGVMLVYIALGLFAYKYVEKRSEQKSYLPKLVIALFFLLPTYDIILTNVLGAFHCLSSKGTFVSKTVEYPESIYWEDNVYPGFDVEDRKLMVKNYLDGIHLKTMALNAPDNQNVYVYECEKDIDLYNQYLQKKQQASEVTEQYIKQKSLLYKQLNELVMAKVQEKVYSQKEVDELSKQEQEKLLHLHTLAYKTDVHTVGETWQRYIVTTPQIEQVQQDLQKNINNIRKLKSNELYVNYFDGFLQQCLNSEKVYTKTTMPKLKYTVAFNEVHSNALSKQFLYLDETTITDNQTHETLAYNKRVMKQFYNLFPAMPGGRFYQSEPICGERVPHLEYRLFDAYDWTSNRLGSHKRDLHSILINRQTNGDK
jgi:hypothetical protein